MIAWGAIPRMTVHRYLEPQSGDRCHRGIGRLQRLPLLRSSPAVVTSVLGLAPQAISCRRFAAGCSPRFAAENSGINWFPLSNEDC